MSKDFHSIPEPRIALDIGSTVVKIAWLDPMGQLLRQRFFPRDLAAGVSQQVRCLLAELGQTTLAVAAFRGALALHPDFPDAHYHLALALEQQGEADEARAHWRCFLELSPDSPWAETARQHVSD